MNKNTSAFVYTRKYYEFYQVHIKMKKVKSNYKAPN